MTAKRRDAMGLVVVGLMALLLLGPVLLHRGFVLVADMTFVPDQPWKPAWLGWDGSTPRSVPADAFVWLLGFVLPGDVIQKLILLGILLGAGAGVLRLTSGLHPAARTTAAVLYVWNPYVYERFAIGHWGLMIGYAAVPWVVSAALVLRRDGAGLHNLAPLALGLAVAAAGSPTGAVVTVLVAMLVAPRNASDAVRIATVGGLVSLPWLLPGFLTAGRATDPHGVTAFASKADTPWGVGGSLLTFGGMWKAAAAPAERADWILSGAALAVSAVALAALLRRAWRRRADASEDGFGASRLLVLASASIVVASASSGPAAPFVEWVGIRVPGGGLFRDAQKWIAPLIVVVAVGLAVAIDGVIDRLSRRNLPSGWVWGLVLVPVMLLPGLAWGLSGRFVPVEYPREWSVVRAILDAHDAENARTVVLPWSVYQRYPWNANRAVLDPAIRFFPGEVVTNDALVMADDSTVAGDSPIAARIGEVIGSAVDVADGLRAEGVSFVVIERTAPTNHLVPPVDGTVLHGGTELAVIALGGAGRAPGLGPPAAVVIVGDAVALGVVTVAFVVVLRRPTRRGRVDQVSSSAERPSDT